MGFLGVENTVRRMGKKARNAREATKHDFYLFDAGIKFDMFQRQQFSTMKSVDAFF